MDEKITFTQEQINKIISYLGTKPYMEVAGILQMINDVWISQNPPKKDSEQN